MANKKAEAVALTTVTDAPVATVDLLAELGLDESEIANDGLGETGREDLKIAIYTLNNTGMGKDGRALPKDGYFDTVTETIKYTVNAVFCLLHKTNVWSVFDNDKKKTEIMCRSFDRLQGVMANGTIRPCLGCPDAQWYEGKDDKGKPKRMRNCAEVHNVYAMDRDTGMPFIVRYKKSSLAVWRTHMQKYHLKRRPLPGRKLGNYPLYAFGVTLTAKMASDKAIHAVPIIEHVETPLTTEEIRSYAAMTVDLALTMQTTLERAETIDEQRTGGGAGGGDDTSFDTSKFADATGDDFTPAADAG